MSQIKSTRFTQLFPDDALPIAMAALVAGLRGVAESGVSTIGRGGQRLAAEGAPQVAGAVALPARDGGGITSRPVDNAS